MPQFATGITGTPVTSAIRPMPFFAFIGQPSGSAVNVPSGKKTTTSPRRSASIASL